MTVIHFQFRLYVGFVILGEPCVDSSTHTCTCYTHTIHIIHFPENTVGGGQGGSQYAHGQTQFMNFMEPLIYHPGSSPVAFQPPWRCKSRPNQLATPARRRHRQTTATPLLRDTMQNPEFHRELVVPALWGLLVCCRGGIVIAVHRDCLQVHRSASCHTRELIHLTNMTTACPGPPRLMQGCLLFEADLHDDADQQLTRIYQ